MKKRIVTLLTLMLTVTLLLSGCGGTATTPSTPTNPPAGNEATADNSWNKVKEKGEFVLGLDDSFPPMGFRDEKNEITGFDIDVAKEVASRLGIKLKLQPISWDAKEQELNTGKIDCIWNGLTITDERKKNILFTKPYMKNLQVVVVKKDATYTKPADLTGKKLGIQTGSSAVDALESAKEFKAGLKEVVEFKDNMTAFMDLDKGGIDAILMDEVVARYNITMKNKPYKVLDESLATEEYGVGFRLQDQQLVQKVQETLDAMAKDGKLAELSNKWFGKDVTTVVSK